jgi:plasmid maintenance system antidote protein VapI
MERNEVNGVLLRHMLANRGTRITAGHISNILKGSRRVSLDLAIALNELTGVPIKTLAEWPRKQKLAKRRSVGRATEIVTTA